MDPASEPTARDVRLAVGGPLPDDWDRLTTAMLKLRWASAVGYANRTLAEPPAEAPAAAILALAEALDRRGALLHELPAGDRTRRVAAAAQRLHITGTIARAVGLPGPLRQLARTDAIATVDAVWDRDLTVGELRVDQAHGWDDGDLTRFLAAARSTRDATARSWRGAASNGAAAGGAETETDESASDEPVARVREAGVVDIAVPHRTVRPSPGHAIR